MEYFRGGGVLHYKFVWKILSAFQAMAEALPAMTNIDVPDLCRLTVVGDLHGQARDVRGAGVVGRPTRAGTM